VNYFQPFSVSAYPNPFSTETTIEVNMANDDNVRISISDCHGRQLGTLNNGRVSAGKIQFVWQPQNEAPGIYFYSVKTKNTIYTGKIVLVK